MKIDKKIIARLSQKERVLEFLKSNKSLDSVESVFLLSVGRLPNRICELKKLGYRFKQEYVSKTNQFGQPYQVMQYELLIDGDDREAA